MVKGPILNFGPNHISEMAKARVVKFCTQVGCQVLALGWQPALKWAWSGSH